MGLFNKSKKQRLIEIEKEFNYDKMMAAAKQAEAEKKQAESEEKLLLQSNREIIYDEMTGCIKEIKFLSQSKVTFVNKDIDNYLQSEIETNMLGIYDNNDNLVLVLTYDLEQKLLFRYMVNYYDNNYKINDVTFSSKLIKPLFVVTEKNTKNIPIDLILGYLLYNLFYSESNFNDFFDMCFFHDALVNTISKLNE